MVARLASLWLGASSNPNFFQSTKIPLIDRPLFELLLDDGFLVGTSALAEAFTTFFDSLASRFLLRLVSLCGTLLFKRVPVDFFAVRAFKRFIGTRPVSRLGFTVDFEAAFVLRALRWLAVFAEEPPLPESARTSSW